MSSSRSKHFSKYTEIKEQACKQKRSDLFLFS